MSKINLMSTALAFAAVTFTAVTFAGVAEARMGKGQNAMMNADKYVTERTVTVTEVPIAGSRRVGMVGGRPYPVIEGIAPIDSGGVYYTEDTDVYYSNPAVDVEVYATGNFNN